MKDEERSALDVASDTQMLFERVMAILLRHIKTLLIHSIPIMVFLLVWEIISRREVVNPRLFPPPSVVWSALLEWTRSGELWIDVKESYWRMLSGFVIGGVAGISLGLLTSRNKWLNWAISPLIQIFRPMPPVAIVPFVIVWLGIGNTAKVFSIAFAVLFPVWINTHLGGSAVSPHFFWSARLLCRSKLKAITKVLIPAALPAIVAGLRTSIAISFIMVYVSEIAGASSGIGYRIDVNHLAYRIDKMAAALLVLALAGAVADFLFAACIRFVFPWTRFWRGS